MNYSHQHHQQRNASTTKTNKQLKQTNKQTNISKGDTIGKQRALSLDIWPIPTIDRVVGYSCV